MRVEDALTTTILRVIQRTADTSGNVTMIRLATEISAELRKDDLRMSEPTGVNAPPAGIEPHAFAVETLWNRGGSSERWGLAMEMEDVRQPLNRGDAEQLMGEMIEDGHAPDGVRLVAIAVVSTSPEGDLRCVSVTA